MLFLMAMFLSLILSGSSQQIISNNCDNCFGQQITEYTCNATGTTLQWVVEPVVSVSQNIIRFTTVGTIGGIIQRGSISGILNSTSPFVSTLRITSDPSLPEAKVVCLSNGINETRPYIRDRFIPMEPVIGNIMNHTMDTKPVLAISGKDMRYITLNMEPVSRTNVIGFSITNSQNNEVMEVEAAQSSATIVLKPEPGTVTFNVTTMYHCPSLSNPVQYFVVVPSSEESVSILVYIWPVIVTVVVIVLLVICLVLVKKVLKLKEELRDTEMETGIPLANKRKADND